MTTARISNNGQMTLPVDIRRKLGIEPRSRVELELRDNEIIIRPLKTISEVAGVFREYAEGVSADWETVRTETERAVAREVADE